MEGCRLCPAGYGCTFGNHKEACAAGYYCPAGTHDSRSIPCPPGTYNPNILATSRSSCLACPKGSYCASLAQTSPDNCPSGHYCDAKGLVLGIPCPAGTYNTKTGSTSLSDCLTCPAGMFCPEKGTSIPRTCPAGTFNDGSSLASSCQPCPPGSACAIGSISPTSCDPGGYSGTGAAECEACQAGYYCDEEQMTYEDMLEKECEPGFTCTLPGVAVKPSLDTHGCPAGHYCTGGSSPPLPCPVGTYGLNLGATAIDECLPAPAGSYVDTPGSTEPSGSCLPGYYCPEGSSSSKEMICPAGTVGRSPGSKSVEECEPCDPGVTCQIQHGTLVQLPCSAGHYCPAGSSVAQRCPEGTYRGFTGGTSVEDCFKCPAGYFCSGTGLSAPSGTCLAGYICSSSSTSPRPTDGISGSACSFGGYCPSGALSKQPCPAGTYNPDKIGLGPADCAVCPPGYYCEGSTSTAPTGLCEAGFICPKGASNPRQKLAPKGHYSEEGAGAATPCPRGTFNPNEGQAQCTLCVAGFYCPDTGAETMLQCPAGYYCEEGSEEPTPCPEGTLSSRTMQPSAESCMPCPPTYYCMGEGNQLGMERPHLCAPGTYGASESLVVSYQCSKCTEGSYCSRTGLSSPEGTYNWMSGAKECKPCPAGFLCGLRVADYTKTRCPAGNYCPAGLDTGAPLQCPAGTFGPTQGLMHVRQCQPCPPGKICTSKGIESPQEACPAGSYCPVGDQSSQTEIAALPCPAGSYCPSGVASPITCPPGKLCTKEGLTEPDMECPAGLLCEAGTSSLDSATLCPVGFVCVEGAADALPCPRGKYSTQSGSGSLMQCRKCPAGQYCDSAVPGQITGLCAAGFYCEEGASSPWSKICPSGKVCPEGSGTPATCPVGTATFADGSSLCSACPAGLTCLGGKLLECEAGAYCDGEAGQAPCPTGTYMPFKGATSVDSCLPCPAGKACPTSGTAIPTNCEEGYYCISQSTSAVPETLVPLSEALAAAAGLSGASTTGGAACPAGGFCPLGTRFAVPCPPGMYCGRSHLTEPQGTCAAGHFCVNSSESDSPQGPTDACPSRSVGGFCPAGHYCPVGSSEPIACPSGSVRQHRLGKDSSSCDPCPAGSFCPSPGLQKAAGECAQGFVCPEGSKDVAEELCPSGSACGGATGEPQACQPGTFQADAGSTSCTNCPAAFYCADAAQPPIACPEGNYCPEGSQSPQPCPPGTYRSVKGGAAEDDCFSCPPGKYCSSWGTKSNLLDCPAGYYCRLGAGTLGNAVQYQSMFTANGQITDHNLSVAVEDPCNGVLPCVYALVCPANTYCPKGSWTPTHCPSGTGHTRRGAASAVECLKCGAGVYCKSSGTQEPCDEGFVCYGAAVTGRPLEGSTGEICPKGRYCPRGTTNSRVCPIGTYGPTKGLSYACDPCPPGRVCQQEGLTEAPNIWCTKGSYCPEGAINPRQCPVGTYNDQLGQPDEWGCLECPPGQYCSSPGLAEPSGPCDQGTWCISGSQINDAVTAYLPLSAVLCPAGYTCESGAIVPTACPKGTYKDTEGEAECSTCPAGVYCAHEAVITAAGDGPCYAGFYCTGGSTTPAPTKEKNGDVCPPHKYCPAGSSTPLDCPAGTFNSNSGMKACPDCTAGYKCAVGVIEECPMGGFCPSGQAEVSVCGAGTIGKAKGFSVQDECADGPCPSGLYCPTGTKTPERCPEGLATASEGAKSQDDCVDCQLGYLCGPLTLNPIICPEGAFCPPGQDLPTACPIGTYQGLRGVMQADMCNPCAAGHTCPTEGMEIYANSVCPWGHYCLQGSAEPEPCLPGTFNDQIGSKSADECTPCPAGFFCPGHKRSFHVSLEAVELSLFRQADMVIQRGQNESYRLACIPKTYCPAGSVEPTPCPETFYCPGESGEPLPCPPNHYCPEETDTPMPCPTGFFCPGGATKPFTCPAGSRAKSTCDGTLTVNACCELCPAGTYSDSNASSVCSPCSAGYVCTGGATSPMPLTAGGHICPAGYYCPAATVVPLPCSPGTYREAPGATDAAECLACPEGTYQRFLAMTSCDTCGSHAVEEKKSGSLTCVCLGKNRVYQHGDKKCSCQQGFVSYDHHLEVAELQDGTLPCQPATFTRCTSTEFRDHLGRCVASVDCTEACGPEGGTFLSSIGICECANALAEAAQCSSKCKSVLPTVTLGTNAINLVDHQTGETTLLEHPDIDLTYAIKYCSMLRELLVDLEVPCRIYFQRADQAGLHALYAPPSSLWAPTKWRAGGTDQRLLAWSRRSSRHTKASAKSLPRGQEASQVGEIEELQQQNVLRRLGSSWRQSFNFELQSMAVNNSVTCILVGSSIVWELKDGVYPVYVEDSLLNSSKTFDSTDFRQLIEAAEDNRLADRGFFVHTFESEGTFVFASSKHKAKISVVRVLAPGMHCPGDTENPTPIRLRPLGLLAISLMTDKLILDPNWSLLVMLLLALLLVVLILLSSVARFVWHRWAATRAPTASSNIYCQDHSRTAVQSYKDSAKSAIDFYVKFLKPTGPIRIAHYRLRDDLLDTTEQEQYDPEADVKPALDRLHVDIDIQDLRVVQATLEKLYDMRETISLLLKEEMKREEDTCSEAIQLVGEMLNNLKQRIECAHLEGGLPISNRHVTSLLHYILSTLQGPEKRQAAEAQLMLVEQELTHHQGEKSAALKTAHMGRKEADILRACVTKAGPSVFDSLDTAAMTAKGSGESVVELQEASSHFAAKATADTEGQRHFLLASIYDSLLKREAKQVSRRFKSLLYLHRHVDLAERRRQEKQIAFAALCSVCREEMVDIQDLGNLMVLQWQQTFLINKFKENTRLLNEISSSLNRLLQETLAELLTAHDGEIPSVVNNLCGSIAALLRQKCSKVTGNWTKSAYSKTAAKELQGLMEQQETQIKAKSEGHMELLRNSLQASHDAAVRHVHLLAEHERSALSKLSKALKKELHAQYAAAAAKTAAAAEAQAEAFAIARKCKASKEFDVCQLVVAGLTYLKGNEERKNSSDLEPESIEGAKKRSLELLAAALLSREEVQGRRKDIRHEHLEQRHQAVLNFIGETSRLLSERAKAATEAAIRLAETTAAAEAELGAPLLRQMGFSCAFEDLSRVCALPERTKIRLQELRQQLQDSFQQTIEMHSKKFQLAHAAAVVAFKRINKQYLDNLKRAFYGYREAVETLEQEASAKLLHLQKEEMKQRMAIKALTAENMSKAFLFGANAEARKAVCQKQTHLLEGYRRHQYDFSELKSRLDDVAVFEEDRAARARDEEESRLFEEITVLKMLGTKENELLELIHSQPSVAEEKALESSAIELHETQVHSATSRTMMLWLEYSQTKATAVVTISARGTSFVESDIAEYCSSWDRALNVSAANKMQDIQKYKAAQKNRLQSQSKSEAAQNMARCKQQLHVANEIIELQQRWGPVASESNQFVHDLLYNLAIHQAEAEFSVDKAALMGNTEVELKSVEAELEKLDELCRRTEEAVSATNLIDEELPSAARPCAEDGSICVECLPDQLESLILTKSTGDAGVRNEESGDNQLVQAFERCSLPTAAAHQVQPGIKSNGPPGKPLEACISDGSGVERQLCLDALSDKGDRQVHAQLLEQYEQRARQAEEETTRERLIQDQRTRQLIQNRRQRLLDQKARLEAKLKQDLNLLELQREHKLEKLQRELHQELVDFSIEFEVEPHELDKLARQLWADSHQRYQKQLRALEKRHLEAMRAAHEAFVQDRDSHHSGTVYAEPQLHHVDWKEVSRKLQNEQLEEKHQLQNLWQTNLEGRLRLLAAKGSESAKGYLEEAKEARRRLEEASQRRFDELRQEQAYAQSAIQELEKIQKRQLDQRLKQVEAQWTQRLHDLKNEEWAKLRQVQDLVEAGFKERKMMLTAAGNLMDNAQDGDAGENLGSHKHTRHEQMMNDLAADMRQLQHALHADKLRQKATHHGKLLKRVEQRRRRILSEAVKDQKALAKDAMEQQEHLLSQQLHRQQFLFSRAKTHQVALKFSQQWLAKARQHLRPSTNVDSGSGKLHELSEKEFFRRYARMRSTLAQSMKQVETLIRGLMPEGSTLEISKFDEGQPGNPENQAACLSKCLQEISHSSVRLNAIQRRYIDSRT
ncbi:uncharacterized protein LOC113146601 [Cyclospora cayetanensis]|uniref:Uncharacterized protein LOC113146601 n=1 Tax=Cyclospora cayetanensis TaxID=88456 RepID=A0A6P6RT11_9EIME|nr:uncharacterized protein LOC113146601 [Cyclospora cayetanensis]